MKNIIILTALVLILCSCALDRSNPLDPVVNDIEVPKEVIGINISHSSSYEIEISWASQDDADGYYIYRCLSINGLYARIDDDTINSGDKESFTDKNIIPGNWYYYKMSAYRWVGDRRLEGWRSGPKTW
ncbi:MAG: hypothetical protein K9M99_09130 [Candidatus Cloacimonetes bacterium]|nr:hypothetical protein [Candidatus Cloacimonadota bacterium]